MDYRYVDNKLRAYQDLGNSSSPAKNLATGLKLNILMQQPVITSSSLQTFIIHCLNYCLRFSSTGGIPK